MKKAFRAAFPVTVPVLLGYLFVGLAFGVLLRQGGYGPLWAAGMSAAVYAGSMQFVMLNFLGGGFSLVQVALMTLAVNFRHLFYGLSFTERFRQMGKKRWYMIYSLTDETYSLLCSQRAPEGVEQGQFFLPSPCWTSSTGLPGRCWARWWEGCSPLTPPASTLP